MDVVAAVDIADYNADYCMHGPLSKVDKVHLPGRSLDLERAVLDDDVALGTDPNIDMGQDYDSRKLGLVGTENNRTTVLALGENMASVGLPWLGKLRNHS